MLNRLLCLVYDLYCDVKCDNYEFVWLFKWGVIIKNKLFMYYDIVFVYINKFKVIIFSI